MVEFSKQNFEDLLKCLDEFELELYKRKTNYFGGTCVIYFRLFIFLKLRNVWSIENSFLK